MLLFILILYWFLSHHMIAHYSREMALLFGTMAHANPRQDHHHVTVASLWLPSHWRRLCGCPCSAVWISAVGQHWDALSLEKGQWSCPPVTYDWHSNTVIRHTIAERGLQHSSWTVRCVWMFWLVCCQREAMRERPARRRGIADSESGSSVSAATSSDSEADIEPPTKKKTTVFICPLRSCDLYC